MPHHAVKWRPGAGYHCAGSYTPQFAFLSHEHHRAMNYRVRHVKLSKFHELTGYTSNAVHQKIKTGVWIEGLHYVKAPDGKLMVDLEEYDRWVRSESAGSSREKRA